MPTSIYKLNNYEECSIFSITHTLIYGNIKHIYDDDSFSPFLTGSVSFRERPRSERSQTVERKKSKSRSNEITATPKSSQWPDLHVFPVNCLVCYAWLIHSCLSFHEKVLTRLRDIVYSCIFQLTDSLQELGISIPRDRNM